MIFFENIGPLECNKHFEKLACKPNIIFFVK